MMAGGMVRRSQALALPLQQRRWSDERHKRDGSEGVRSFTMGIDPGGHRTTLCCLRPAYFQPGLLQGKAAGFFRAAQIIPNRRVLASILDRSSRIFQVYGIYQARTGTAGVPQACDLWRLCSLDGSHDFSHQAKDTTPANPCNPNSRRIRPPAGGPQKRRRTVFVVHKKKEEEPRIRAHEKPKKD